MRRMQNNPLETKRPHRDKVATKAAAASKKAVQGSYYRHLFGERFTRLKLNLRSFPPAALKQAFKEFNDGIYLSDQSNRKARHFSRPAR